MKSILSWFTGAVGLALVGYQIFSSSNDQVSGAKSEPSGKSFEQRASLKPQSRTGTEADTVDSDNSDVDPIIRGGQGVIASLLVDQQPDQIVELRQEAVRLLRQAAEDKDPQLIEDISKLPKSCVGCDEFFTEARSMISNSGLGYDQRAYVADILAKSGRADNQKFLLDQLNSSSATVEAESASALPASEGEELLPPAVIGNALEGSTLQPEVIDEIQQSLESDNKYVRDAAVSILTQQGTLESIQKLYDFTIRQNDPTGFYSDGMGIGKVKPVPEAIPYLETMVQKNDAYSHLALKALLNAGDMGRERAIALLQSSAAADSKPNYALIKNAVDHWPLYGAAYTQIESLKDSPNPTLKLLADQVVKEHLSLEASKNKEFQNNEHSQDGLIDPNAPFGPGVYTGGS